MSTSPRQKYSGRVRVRRPISGAPILTPHDAAERRGGVGEREPDGLAPVPAPARDRAAHSTRHARARLRRSDPLCPHARADVRRGLGLTVRLWPGCGWSASPPAPRKSARSCQKPRPGALCDPSPRRGPFLVTAARRNDDIHLVTCSVLPSTRARPYGARELSGARIPRRRGD